jgi:hypothetical protein
MAYDWHHCFSLKGGGGCPALYKEKSGKALPVARKHSKLKHLFPIVLVLVLAAFFVLDRTANRQLGEHLPAVIDYLQKTSGLRCEIQNLAYRFPSGVRALDVRISDDSGREWLNAASITAKISPFRYLMSGKVGRHLIRSIDAENLNVTLYHKNTSGWKFPGIRRSAENLLSGTAPEEAPINLNVHNLTINFRTEKKTTTHTYRTMTARLDLKKGLDSLDVAGDNERFHLSLKRDSGEFDLKADSFGLAILSPLLGDTIPLDDMHITARAKGGTEKDKEMSFTLSGAIEHSRQRGSFLSPLEAKAAIFGFNMTGGKNDSRISIRNGQIVLGGESLFVDGRFSNAQLPEIKMVFSFPEFSIGNALSTLPKSFHPDLPDLKVKGKVAGKLHFFIDMERPRSLAYRFEGKYEPVKILSLGSKIKVTALKSPFRHTVRTPKGEKITFLVGEDNSQYVPLQDIPPSLISAVITAEDAGFFSHKGFSQRGIKDSFAENLQAGRIVRGASTISMQVAKNLFLTRERTFSRKFEETFITMALEQNLSKERIMEIYLNIIEWGDGIYGIGPAAHFYFSKAPEKLKPVESAFLASIIARPVNNWEPEPLSRISEGWWKYLQVILCKMHRRGGAEIADLREAGVPETRIRELVADKKQDETAPSPPD